MKAKRLISSNMLLNLVLLVAVVMIMVALRRCGRPDATPAPSGGDTIDVCIEYSPLSFYTYADTLGGFDYDLLRLIAERHRLPMKFHPGVSLPVELAGLQSGQYDLLVSQFPMTVDAKDRYLFTDSIYHDRQTLVQRCDTAGAVTVGNQLDLAGRTVWVVKDSPMRHRLRTLSHEIGDTIIIREEAEYGAEQLVIMVAKGQIDYAVVNERVARRIAGDYPNVDFGTRISLTQIQSWVLPLKKQELRDSLNVWIRELRAGKEYARLRQRYFQ